MTVLSTLYNGHKTFKERYVMVIVTEGCFRTLGRRQSKERDGTVNDYSLTH